MRSSHTIAQLYMAGPASEPRPWTLNTLIENEEREKGSTGSEGREGDERRRCGTRPNIKIQHFVQP